VEIILFAIVLLIVVPINGLQVQLQ